MSETMEIGEGLAAELESSSLIETPSLSISPGLGAIVPAANFQALSKTEFHENELARGASTAVSEVDSISEGSTPAKGSSPADERSRSVGGGDESRLSIGPGSEARDEKELSPSSLSGSGTDSGVCWENSASGICMAASESCSQGIGEDNVADGPILAGSIDSGKIDGSGSVI